MNSIRKLLLDEKHQIPNTAQVTGRRNANTPQSTATSPPAMLSGAIAVTLIALILSIAFNGKSDSATTGVAINPNTLCPLDDQNVVSETYIHIDLSEKLTEEQHGWLLDLLGVAQNSDMQPHSLFSISQMQTISTAPRVEVHRFCIPNISDIGAAGRSVKKENCQEIAEDDFDWKQHRTRHIGGELRRKIESACRAYVNLKSRVEEAADRYKNVNLGQNRSYIIGSIDDVMHASNPNIPPRLIVFSDMLQNAKWFSQYNMPSDEWSANKLKKLRKSETAIKEMGGKPPSSDIKFSKVLLCYLPSTHSILANARSRKAHKNMWEDYFDPRMIPAGKFQAAPASACAKAAEILMQG